MKEKRREWYFKFETVGNITEFVIKAENELTADIIDVLIKVLLGIKKELTQ